MVQWNHVWRAMLRCNGLRFEAILFGRLREHLAGKILFCNIFWPSTLRYGMGGRCVCQKPFAFAVFFVGGRWCFFCGLWLGLVVFFCEKLWSLLVFFLWSLVVVAGAAWKHFQLPLQQTVSMADRQCCCDCDNSNILALQLCEPSSLRCTYIDHDQFDGRWETFVRGWLEVLHGLIPQKKHWRCRPAIRWNRPSFDPTWDVLHKTSEDVVQPVLLFAYWASCLDFFPDWICHSAGPSNSKIPSFTWRRFIASLPRILVKHSATHSTVGNQWRRWICPPATNPWT